MSKFDDNQLAASLSALVADLLGQPQEARNEPDVLRSLLLKNKAFDPDYYLRRYKDVRAAGMDPIEHYIKHGFREKRHPGRWHKELVDKGIMLDAPEATDVAAEMEHALASLLVRRHAYGPNIIMQGSYEAFTGLPLSVHWSITSKCNYRCSYCSFFLPKQGTELYNPGKDELFLAVDKLAALGRDAYQFVLLGGEPTVSPDLPDLLRHMSRTLGKSLKHVIIVSNGSRKAEYFNQFADLASRIDFQIMNSLHLEFKKPEEIYALVNDLDPCIQLNLLLMTHPEKLSLAKQIHGTLCELRKSRPFHLIIHPIYGAPDFSAPDPRYPKDFFSWWDKAQQQFDEINLRVAIPRPKEFKSFTNCFWILKSPWGNSKVELGDRFKFIENGLLNFRDKFCLTGANLLRIEESGKVMGTTCGHAGTELNIYRDELDPDKFMRLIRCPADTCICSDNDLLMKFSEEAAGLNFMELAKNRQARAMQDAKNLS